jgi:hypothetical protein
MCCGPLMGQVSVNAPMGMQGNVSQTVNVSNTGGGQSHDHTLSANFSGSANSVLQPYLVLIYIIKT